MALSQYRISEANQKQAEEDHYYIDGRTRSVASVKDDETAERLIKAGCTLFDVIPPKPTFDALAAAAQAPESSVTEPTEESKSTSATEPAEEVKTPKSKTKS